MKNKPLGFPHLRDINYVVKDSDVHRMISHGLAKYFEKQNVPLEVATLLATEVPTGIMEIDDNNQLIFTSQMRIMLDTMVKSYKVGVGYGRTF